jgi:hypothetical protein
VRHLTHGSLFGRFKRMVTAPHAGRGFSIQ